MTMAESKNAKIDRQTCFPFERAIQKTCQCDRHILNVVDFRVEDKIRVTGFGPTELGKWVKCQTGNGCGIIKIGLAGFLYYKYTFYHGLLPER